MGCDGGSIPTRRELVKSKPRKTTHDDQQIKNSEWYYCRLSNEPLKAPLVACGLGRLYNKEAVIRFLLDRAVFGDNVGHVSHIKSLRDVVTLSTTANTAAHDSGRPFSQASSLEMHCEFACPITGKEMNGSAPFIYISSCGCVMSCSALKEVPARCCLKCGQSYIEDDIVPIYGSADQLARLSQRLAGKRGGSGTDNVPAASTRSKRHKADAAMGGPISLAKLKEKGEIRSLKKTKTIADLYHSTSDDKRGKEEYLCRTFYRYA